MPSNKNGWEELMNIFVKNIDNIDIICDFLFTKEEKEQINKRILLTKELIKKDKSQREISKDMGVSISTITRCSNALKDCPKEIRRIFNSK